MVAIQFKCTYKQYRKLTVWHIPPRLKLRSIPCPRQGGTPIRTRCIIEVMREQHTSTTDTGGTKDSCACPNDGTTYGGLRATKNVHNSQVRHWGLDLCRRRLDEGQQRRGERRITDRMIREFIRQCPACQVMNRMRLQIKTHRPHWTFDEGRTWQRIHSCYHRCLFTMD